MTQGYLPFMGKRSLKDPPRDWSRVNAKHQPENLPAELFGRNKTVADARVVRSQRRNMAHATLAGPMPTTAQRFAAFRAANSTPHRFGPRRDRRAKGARRNWLKPAMATVSKPKSWVVVEREARAR